MKKKEKQPQSPAQPLVGGKSKPASMFSEGFRQVTRSYTPMGVRPARPVSAGPGSITNGGDVERTDRSNRGAISNL